MLLKVVQDVYIVSNCSLREIVPDFCKNVKFFNSFRHVYVHCCEGLEEMGL